MWITLTLLVLTIMFGVLSYIFRVKITIKHTINSQPYQRDTWYLRDWLLNLCYIFFIIFMVFAYLGWLTLQPI